MNIMITSLYSLVCINYTSILFRQKS